MLKKCQLTDHQRQIRKVRDEHAKECGYNVHRAFEQLRAETEQLKKKVVGWLIALLPALWCGKKPPRHPWQRDNCPLNHASPSHSVPPFTRNS